MPNGPKEPTVGPHDDQGVSPVVGMILVLAISIVGIAAILYWGLPAIDEMKANVEYRSVTTQFTELDTTIHELVSGTTEKTAKRWEPSINRGELRVQNRTEGWVYAMEVYDSRALPHYNFSYSGLDDADNAFSITTTGVGPANWVVEGYIVTGSSSQTTLNVTTPDSTTAPVPAQMSSVVPVWAANTPKEFKVWQKDVCCALPASDNPKQLLRDATFHFRILSSGQVIAEMWFVQTGRAVYDLHAGVGAKTVILNNGAVIDGSNGAYSIVNTPSIPPDSTSSGSPRFFGRSIALDGDVGFAGDDHFSLLVSLDSTATLASYDCVLASKADCAQSSKIQIFGDYDSIWKQYLTNANMGYHFVSQTEPNGGPDVLAEYNHEMAYTLLGSTLQVSQ